MGKNIHGGSGHKKFARKFTTNTKNNNKLRISEDIAEIYAIVTKMLGNGMFHCHCIDGTIRLGHIRGKFSGRGKRENVVEGGKWVLIGLREWDVPSESSTIINGKKKMQQCDLLEVYSDMDKFKLKETVSVNWSELDNNDVTREAFGKATDIYDDVVFGTERDFEREKLVNEMKSSTTERITFKIGENNSEEAEEEIDIDDI
jgi:initiation factor 1A